MDAAFCYGKRKLPVPFAGMMGYNDDIQAKELPASVDIDENEKKEVA